MNVTKHGAFFFLILLLAGCASRPGIKRIRPTSEIPKETGTSIAAQAVSRTYTVGEYYTFELTWLGVSVGQVTYAVEREGVIDGRPVYVTTIRANTNKYASKIYKVNDIYTSYIDQELLIPLRYDVDRSEGSYRKDATTRFDHDKGIAYFHNYHDGSSKEYPIPKGVLDPVSAVIKLRAMPIDVGESLTIPVANHEKVYTMKGLVERRDHIEVKGIGTFEAFFIEPYAILKGNRVKKGKVQGYISTGANRVLLYAEVKAPVFTKITATLVDYAPKD